MKLPQTLDQIEKGIQRGDHFGAQLALSFSGETFVQSCGNNAPFLPLEDDHLLLWLSACKPVAAVACGILMDRGLLDLHRPVAELIPDFAQRGKAAITPFHLLTHTAGIRGGTLGWRAMSWEEAIGRVCETKPEPRWVPGMKAGYHVDNAWYMLGELVRVLDGRGYSDFVREEIFLPLEMPNCWVGMPDQTFETYGDQIAWIYDCEGEAPEISDVLCRPEAVTGCRPGGSGRGPAQEFLHFYQAMSRMAEGEDGILRSATAQTLLAPHRVGMFDHTFRCTMDWGLGFMRQSDHYDPGETPYQFGSHASRRAFGHCGNQSTAAFSDPENGLSVALLFNGMPGEERHQIRLRATLNALYEELGLV